jgi:hypothetical protein
MATLTSETLLAKELLQMRVDVSLHERMLIRKHKGLNAQSRID